MDTYGASISVLVIAVAEMVAIMWVYGANNFCKDLQAMLGFYPGLYFKVSSVGLLCPVTLPYHDLPAGVLDHHLPFAAGGHIGGCPHRLDGTILRTIALP